VTVIKQKLESGLIKVWDYLYILFMLTDLTIWLGGAIIKICYQTYIKPDAKCIPATSTASERAFSDARNLITDKRSAISIIQRMLIK